MDYKLWFWLLVAFLIGKYLPRTFYIGHDADKYEKADLGIFLGKRTHKENDL